MIKSKNLLLFSNYCLIYTNIWSNILSNLIIKKVNNKNIIIGNKLIGIFLKI